MDLGVFKMQQIVPQGAWRLRHSLALNVLGRALYRERAFQALASDILQENQG